MTWSCRSVEDDIIIDPVDAPEIVDDFEIGLDEAVEVKDKEINKQKLRRRIDQYKVGVSSCYYEIAKTILLLVFFCCCCND